MSNKEENNKNTGTFNNIKEPAKNYLDFKLEEDEKTFDSISSSRFARRMRSTYISTRPNLFLEEKEDIVINLFKKQRKLNNYSENKESITFSERQNVFTWCLSVLEPISLEEYQKTSIFHRFCTAYDYIMDKLFVLKKDIKDQTELKTMVIPIFLLSYKMEGFSLAKLTISSLVNAFMKDVNVDKNELSDKIYKNEIEIIGILDFNPQIFDDNNIHQISYILLDLFIGKYSLKFKESEKKKIYEALDYLNNSIEFSDKMLFQYLAIDKAMLSFYSVIEYCCLKRQTVLDALKKYNRYLRNNLNVIKLMKEEYDKYCIKFAKILFKNKK